MVTLKDIAEATGFSVSVVSRALSSDKAQLANVSPKTRNIIRRKVREKGYMPNHSAAFLKRGQAASIGIFLPENHTSLLNDLIAGISMVAADNNIPLNFYFGLTSGCYMNFIDKMKAISTAGIITYWPFEEGAQKVLYSRLDSLIADGRKIIFLHTDPLKRKNIPAVTVDNFQGGYLAGKRLTSIGCKNIVCVFSDQGSYRRNRFAGFCQAMNDCDQEFVALKVHDSNLNDWQEMEAFMGKIIGIINGQEEVGLFVDSDPHALRIGNALNQMGYMVGKRVKLIGFDDIAACQYFSPRLTTIRQPFEKMGKLAMGKLLNMLRGKKETSEMIKPELIVRDSA